MKQFYFLSIVFLLNSCGTKRQNDRRISVTKKELLILASRINAKDISYHPDSSQLTVNIINSQLVERLLEKPTTEQPDSVYLVTMKLGQLLNQLLNQDSKYENLYLTFQTNEQQNYYFDFCIRKCE